VLSKAFYPQKNCIDTNFIFCRSPIFG
jgi:hypothetical protein